MLARHGRGDGAGAEVSWGGVSPPRAAQAGSQIRTLVPPAGRRGPRCKEGATAAGEGKCATSRSHRPRSDSRDRPRLRRGGQPQPPRALRGCAPPRRIQAALGGLLATLVPRARMVPAVDPMDMNPGEGEFTPPSPAACSSQDCGGQRSVGCPEGESPKGGSAGEHVVPAGHDERSASMRMLRGSPCGVQLTNAATLGPRRGASQRVPLRARFLPFPALPTPWSPYCRAAQPPPRLSPRPAPPCPAPPFLPAPCRPQARGAVLRRPAEYRCCPAGCHHQRLPC